MIKSRPEKLNNLFYDVIFLHLKINKSLKAFKDFLIHDVK